MKTRNGFVSNSSSASFLIKNCSKNSKTLVDFAADNRKLVEKFNHQYDAEESLGELISDAEELDIVFKPKESMTLTFGDSDGNTIGRVYDYILRSGGETRQWKWKLVSMNR